MYKILRRGSGRMFVLCAVLVSLLLCLYYVNQTQGSNSTAAGIIGAGDNPANFERVMTSVVPDYSEPPDALVSRDTCPLIVPREADIDAQAEFEKFEFQVSHFIIILSKIFNCIIALINTILKAPVIYLITFIDLFVIR